MLDPERSHIEHPCNSLCEFSDEIVERIADSLPAPLTPRHRELLPNILREWSNNELRRHLSWGSRAQEHRLADERVDAAAECFRQAMKALNDLNEDERRRWVSRMFQAQGRDFFDLDRYPSRSEFADEARRLNEESVFLAKYAAIEPPRPRRRGHPQNIPAYLALQDAASIFEWYSGRKAARGVQVVEHDGIGKARANEAGPFHRFASVLWPALFGDGTSGLTAAMKNWASWRRKYGERSALVANIDLRHREWGVFIDSAAHTPLLSGC
jgi:hypothetical protein